MQFDLKQILINYEFPKWHCFLKFKLIFIDQQLQIKSNIELNIITIFNIVIDY